MKYHILLNIQTVYGVYIFYFYYACLICKTNFKFIYTTIHVFQQYLGEVSKKLNFFLYYVFFSSPLPFIACMFLLFFFLQQASLLKCLLKLKKNKKLRPTSFCCHCCLLSSSLIAKSSCWSLLLGPFAASFKDEETHCWSPLPRISWLILRSRCLPSSSMVASWARA